ncbi:MAG: 5'/3'-nucleotidase SurE [Thermoprotei archaeon]|nr:MAG: 5'/3'-nucleotidase SurE [Thermoprotei archaeon]
MPSHKRFKILITNDDGPFSPGLKLLYDAVKDLGECFVVVPETPKSASGLGITLHKPLRIKRLVVQDVPMYLVNGAPSDIIYVAENSVCGRPNLVLSGVNIGDNTSVQVVLSSGTVGAALQAALENIPGISFSVAADSPEKLEEKELWQSIWKAIRMLVKHVVEEGFPEGVDVLNVNFPSKPAKTFKYAPLARLRFSNLVVKRRDPRGVDYYWLYGEPVQPEPGTDVYTVLVEEKISVTPISIRGLTGPSEPVLKLLKRLSVYLSI